MSYLLEGVRAGLLLALLVGPLVVLLLQLSLRRGTAAALAAAFGVWLSDLLFILATHYGIGSVEELTIEGAWGVVLGSVGALLLIGSAVYMWFRKPPDLSIEREELNRKGLIAGVLQGFALNTFNPFTVGFWSVFTLTQVHERELDVSQAWAIYGGILGAIIVTDCIKVLAARRIRDWLKPTILLRIQQAGALILGGIGVLMVFRLLGEV